jgi:hypothetical protein
VKYVPCKPSGQSHWTQRTALGGRDYVLTFDWSQRDGHWSLSVADQDEEPIASGLSLVTDWPLLRGVIDARRPPGELLVVDTLDERQDPGFADLGDRFLLVYAEPEDLA